MIQAAILDIDGTLLDSNDAHAKCWQRALAEQGVQRDYEKIRFLIGMGGDKLIPKLTGQSHDSELGKNASKRHRELFLEEYLPHLKPFPEAKALLLRMSAGGLRLCVASSADPAELKPILSVVDPQNEIPWIVPSKEGTGSKPDPDLITRALHSLGLLPSDTLMLGDTPYDIEGARGAGVRAIALRCGGRTDSDLRGALAIYDDPKDLLRNLDVSPFFADSLSARAG